ncbi:hypothetical protein BASA81_000690 [Batrachochytrium salamandrivorans]|nr:hypothetical protein BASA81_000690 [Batrachochytrium salamandrivorans]
MEVQRALEKSLPELEVFLEHKILSEEEVRLLVVKRREFESRLRRFELVKEDALEYIGFEMQLNKLVELRRQKRNAKYLSQFNFQKQFETKVNQVFDLLMKKFKGDLDLWVAAIEFAQSLGNDGRVSQICGKGIRLFPTKEMFWVVSAKHELERNSNVTQARQVLITALKTLPRNETVWLEYFRMEFLFVYQVLERREVQGLEITDFHEQLLLTVFENATRAIPQRPEFQLQFLQIASLFSGKRTGELVRDFLLESLQREFPTNRQVLLALASAGVATDETKSAVWFETQIELALGRDDATRVDELVNEATERGMLTEQIAVLITKGPEDGEKEVRAHKRQRLLERFTGDFPANQHLWERRCELDATAFEKTTLPLTGITPAMWRLELQRHPNETVGILAKVKPVVGAELITFALQIAPHPSKLVVDLERKVVNRIPEASFCGLWEGGSVIEVEEKRLILEQWVKRHPSQRAFQSYIEFEASQGNNIKPLLLRAMGLVKGFSMQ